MFGNSWLWGMPESLSTAVANCDSKFFSSLRILSLQISWSRIPIMLRKSYSSKFCHSPSSTYLPFLYIVSWSPKLIPWFVSDVTPVDFKSTIASLLSDTFFPPPSTSVPSEGATINAPEAVEPPSRPEEHEYLRLMVTRWKIYIDSGVFVLSVPSDTRLGANDAQVCLEILHLLVLLSGNGNPQANFWTSPWPYWNMKERAPEVWNNLKESGLIIFKVCQSCLLQLEINSWRTCMLLFLQGDLK